MLIYHHVANHTSHLINSYIHKDIHLLTKINELSYLNLAPFVLDIWSFSALHLVLNTDGIFLASALAEEPVTLHSNHLYNHLV